MEIWIKISQLILSLSILIVLHELGHMIPAKLFKTRVEKFYLFFNPWFSLFRYKKVGGKKKYSWFSKESPSKWEKDPNTTEWGLGWLPLGGYVKISGMIDESMDKEQMEKPAEPWEFRSKPPWQRLIIMVGGVVVNLILGCLIYIMVLFVWGEEYLPTENAKYGAHLSDDIFLEYGLQDGDKIIQADGIKSKHFGDINTMIIIDGARNLTIERDNKIIDITLDDEIIDHILANKLKGVISSARVPNIIKQLTPGVMGAKNAGLQKGDSIVKINDLDVPFFYDFSKELAKHKGKEIELTYYRNNLMQVANVLVSDNGYIGYSPVTELNYFDVEKKEYNIIQAIPAGISKGYSTLSTYVKSLSLLFSKEGAQQLGGFGTIGNLFPAQWDWYKFWMLTALISIILAFMNILPIPALDGGHVMFLLYEIFTGKPPSDKFLTRAQVVGMGLLLTLLLYANGMDVYRWVTGG
jgi:regulator of sigma E protease